MSTESPISGDPPLLETRGHTTSEGFLNLSVQVGVPDADVVIAIRVQPTKSAVKVDDNGWPVGYFDRVVGSMPDLERAPQGEFEKRLPLE